jgi:hypothetical protein
LWAQTVDPLTATPSHIGVVGHDSVSWKSFGVSTKSLPRVTMSKFLFYSLASDIMLAGRVLENSLGAFSTQSDNWPVSCLLATFSSDSYIKAVVLGQPVNPTPSTPPHIVVSQDSVGWNSLGASTKALPRAAIGQFLVCSPPF